MIYEFNKLINSSCNYKKKGTYFKSIIILQPFFISIFKSLKKSNFNLEHVYIGRGTLGIQKSRGGSNVSDSRGFKWDLK